MEALLQSEALLGLTLWQLSVATALVILSIFCRGLVRMLFRIVLRRWAAPQKASWAADLHALMPGPTGVFLRVLLWVAAVRMLELPVEPVNVQQFVLTGLWLAIGLAGVWTLFRLTDCASRWATRASDRTESKLDDQLVPLLSRVFKVVIFAVVGVMGVERMGFSVTSLVASLGLGGLALALAAKDTVSNVFGSLVVFADRPFQIDDWIEIDGIEGVVEEVGIRTTRVRRFDKSIATIPNARLTGTTIFNYSKRPSRRIRLNVGIAYTASSDQLEQLVEGFRSMMRKMPDIDQEGIQSFVHAYSDSSIDLLVQCWTKSPDHGDYMAAKERVLLEVLRLVEKRGLKIAFPTRTVYLEGGAEKGDPTHG